MNPATATFLTKDPFAGYLHLVMSRNGYSYVHGNPVNFTDPTGEFVWFAALPLAGKVVVAGATALTGVLATLWIVNQMPSVEELQRFCDNIGQNFHPSNIPGNLRRAMQHFPPMRIFPGVWLDFSGSSSQVQTDTLIVEARITPRSGRDWNYLARKLGIDRNTLRENLHSCKEWAGVRGDQNVQVDDESGDIYYRGEYIGNIVDGC